MKKENRSLTKSEELFIKAEQVIPGGIFGHYKYSMGEASPKFFSKAKDSHFWDVDGNEYIDLMCAYGPMILGYNNPVIDKAAQAQYDLGNTVSLASPVMIELAETLVDMVSIADWALFGKNGGDSTALAVMIARAETGRSKIIKINDGYHGVASWMQRQKSPGVDSSDTDKVISIDWNDIDSLEKVISDNPNEVACFISSPYHHPVLKDNVLPEDQYWKRVETLCRKNGIVLIVDDVRAGFRINLAGSNVAYGFKPDLICLGKAMANGYPISALVGTDALKESAEKVYYTGTQFFNAAPMAASKATLLELQRIDAANLITNYGNKLKEGLEKVALNHNYNLEVSGVSSMPYFRIKNEDISVHNNWVEECVKRGLYIVNYHNHFISASHTEEDLVETLKIASDAFIALGEMK
jgi:glutamate-1-semialdehyde 2,1-aminomutase